MPTLNDVAHLCSWNGYARDMRFYKSVNRATWNCKEMWIPYDVNMLYGKKRKSRIQRICEQMIQYNSEINYINAFLLSYDPLVRVKKLIAFGGDVDIQDKDGTTPLMVCACNGWADHIDMIKILLRAGADINKKNAIGFSALHYASYNNHINIIKELLLRRANIHSLDIYGFTPIQWAAQNGHIDVVKLLLDRGARLDSSLMKSAIRGKKPLPIIKYLHKKGCELSESPLYSALSNKNYLIIKTLVKIGADPNERIHNLNVDLGTVLSWFIEDSDAVLALCKVGANVNINIRNIPLIFTAINKQKRKLAVLKILSNYKVNFNVQDDLGLTPLHIVVDDAVLGNREDLMFVKEILKNTTDFTRIDNFGENVLDMAKAIGDKEIICEINREILRKRSAGYKQ